MSTPTFYTKTQISHLKVEELKSALSQRGLETHGTRPELQKRLRNEIHLVDSSQVNLSVTDDSIGISQVPSVEQTGTWDIIRVKQGPVFKRIPKASRLQSCIAFTKVLNNVTTKNDKSAWSDLFNFARCGLGSSSRGGKKKKSQATLINKRLDRFMSGSQQVSTQTKRRQPPTLKQQVTSKMAVADIKGAVRLLVSNDTILPPSEDTIQKLKQKHPMKHSDFVSSPEIKEEASCFKTNRDDILRALHSFKKGAAGGPDGFLPQHLIDMSGSALGEPATQLVNALVSFMNLIVFPGNVPEEITETFYGATLIALSKEDGGVRPIAIGFTLRRLAAKVLMFVNKDFCASHFSPNQLGVGTPKGAESCVHAVRRYLRDQSSNVKY